MKLTSSLDLPPVTCPQDFGKKFSDRYLRKDIAPYVASVAASAPLGASPIHGFRHWLTVLDNGLQIIDATLELHTDVNRPIIRLSTVMLLFALFHDSRRETEGHCAEHGKAGSMFLQSIHRDELVANLGVTYKAISLAAYACECHTIADVPMQSPLLKVGAPSPLGGTLLDWEVAIVRACLDADRLDLGRVGITPNPFYLSTECAKDYATELNVQLANR